MRAERKKQFVETNPMRVRSGEAVFCYAVMVIMCVIALFPLVWVILASFKKDLLLNPGFTLPDSVYLGGYEKVLTRLGIWKYFLNSAIIATCGTLISITILTMAAYVIARYRFTGRRFVSACFMATMFVPTSALTFPVYHLVKNLGLFNTRTGLILVYACSGIAISFMVIRNYFAIIPRELDEAARIDGASYFQTFLHVMLPIARPGIFTAAVLHWLNMWNEFYWASLLMIDRSRMTVPAILSQFVTSFSTDYNGLLSAIVVIMIPPVLLFSFSSKYFIQALSGGAVKG